MLQEKDRTSDKALDKRTNLHRDRIGVLDKEESVTRYQDSPFLRRTGRDGDALQLHPTPHQEFLLRLKLEAEVYSNELNENEQSYFGHLRRILGLITA